MSDLALFGKSGGRFFHAHPIFPLNAGSGRDTTFVATDAPNMATEIDATANCLAFAPICPTQETRKVTR